MITLHKWLPSLMMLFTLAKNSGGGGSSKQTVQNYSPEEAKRRTKLMDTAEGVYNATAGTIASSPYPGANVAGFSPTTLAAQQGLIDTANGASSDYAQGTYDATRYNLYDVLNPEANEYLQASVQGAIRPITESWTDAGGVMSGIRNNSVMSGGYGGSRQGIAEGIAAGRYADAIGDVSSRMYSDAYNKGLDQQARTLAMMPQLQQTAERPSMLYGAVGTQQDQLQQAKEDYAANARDWELNKNWEALYPYANIVLGAGGSQSTSKTTGTAAQPSALGGALSGGLLGYGLASAFPAAAINPWLGAGIGALGGALGLF